MKVKLVSLLLVFLVSFAGCAKGSDAQNVSMDDEFSCIANVHYNGTKIKAFITKQSSGYYTIEMIEPGNLKGIVLQWDGGDLSVGYKGLSVSIDPALLPDTAFGSILINSFNMAAKKDGYQITNDGEIVKLEGISESGAFSIVLDKTTGTLISVDVPSMNLSATFEEYTVQ